MGAALMMAVDRTQAELDSVGVEADIVDSTETVHELGASLSGDGGGMHGMAAKAHAKASFALNKIKTAKELREKARQVLTAKGKPIPEILQKGALDDVHQRVIDAQERLSSKFGAAPSNDGEREMKVQKKRDDKDGDAADAKVTAATAEANAQSEEAKTKLQAAKKM